MNKIKYIIEVDKEKLKEMNFIENIVETSFYAEEDEAKKAIEKGYANFTTAFNMHYDTACLPCKVYRVTTEALRESGVIPPPLSEIYNLDSTKFQSALEEAIMFCKDYSDDNDDDDDDEAVFGSIFDD